MEAAGIVSSPVLRFSDAGVDNRFFKLPFRQLGMVNSRVSFKARDDTGILSRGFSDSGHMQYYVSPSMGGGQKQKEKSKEIKTDMKKNLKLIKRLSKDLDFLVRTVTVEEYGSRLMHEVKGKTLSETTEVLLAELQHLRSKQNEQKRKRKEEKTRRKATLVKAKAKIDAGSSSSSSSSSSESSDSDCGVAMGISSLRSNALKQFIDHETEEEQENNKEQATLAEISSSNQEEEQENNKEQATLAEISSSNQEENNSFSLQNLGGDCCNECSRSNNSNDHESSGLASGRRIEICMGGRCKKLGAVALLEEFERKVGTEGAVVGCKCMGKCKNGPNVRIQNESAKGSVEPPINPLSLCSRVELEDVDEIVRNFLGKDRNDNCLMASS
ncbi:hypothetical protein P3X46_014989 [Hevea brasiliensis]|uniref:Diacylglycerol O-acyltransferase n=1 Tax=Hevea brasiliensis TaxID=3981 RepID=A0ABQ9LWQ3_HEVBR|nr:diacylglycerol O-acyltransferase 3 [Hevea brasiliensis]KAJ9171657.1 hypothetical protein P3X46_014989 [Hevea brasiliensis]